MNKWFKERTWFLVTVGVLYGLFVVVLLLLWGRSAPLPGTQTPRRLDWLWLGAVAVYTVLSFRTVETREKAVKTVFKRDIQNVPRGLTFVPLFICDLITFDRVIIFLEVGTPQELAVRGEGGKIIGTEEAKTGQEILRVSTEPLRVTFASFAGGIWRKKWYLPEGYTEAERQTNFPIDDHLSRRLTSDPNVVVWFTIRNQSKFVAVVGSREKALELMEKVTMVALQEYCSKRTLSFVLHHLEDAQDYLRHRLEQLVGDPDAQQRAKDRVKKIKKEARRDPTKHQQAEEAEGNLMAGWDEKESWGVDIHGIKIKTMGLPLRVNQAMGDARAAGYEADAVAIRAEGTKKALVLEGQGRGEQEEAILLGRMEGYRAQKDKLKISGEQALAADTGRAVAENVGNLLVTDSSILANIIGAIAAGKGVLTGQPAPRPPKKRRRQGNGSPPPPTPPASPGTSPPSPSP